MCCSVQYSYAPISLCWDFNSNIRNSGAGFIRLHEKERIVPFLTLLPGPLCWTYGAQGNVIQIRARVEDWLKLIIYLKLLQHKS